MRNKIHLLDLPQVHMMIRIFADQLLPVHVIDDLHMITFCLGRHGRVARPDFDPLGILVNVLEQ